MGMAHQGGKTNTPRCPLSLRGVHTAKGDVSPGETRFHTVLQLFSVAEYEVAAHAVFHRADADGGAGIPATEPLAQHPGHSDRASAAWGTPGIHVSAGVSGNARSQLRYLWSGIRTAGEPSARGRRRGIFEFGEI